MTIGGAQEAAVAADRDAVTDHRRTAGLAAAAAAAAEGSGSVDDAATAAVSADRAEIGHRRRCAAVDLAGHALQDEAALTVRLGHVERDRRAERRERDAPLRADPHEGLRGGADGDERIAGGIGLDERGGVARRQVDVAGEVEGQRAVRAGRRAPFDRRRHRHAGKIARRVEGAPEEVEQARALQAHEQRDLRAGRGAADDAVGRRVDVDGQRGNRHGPDVVEPVGLEQERVARGDPSVAAHPEELQQDASVRVGLRAALRLDLAAAAQRRRDDGVGQRLPARRQPRP
ncbi:MAG: hypothetical protein U0531_22475 [Dehalococcoidia bacterium]